MNCEATVIFETEGRRYQIVIDVLSDVMTYGVRERSDPEYPYMRALEQDGTISLEIKGRVRKPFTEIGVPVVIFPWF